MAYRLKHRIEYVALRTAMTPLRFLPFRLALALAWLVAFAMHRLFGFRADEARERIRTVLGARTPEREVRRIAWISWRNLCFNVVEMARFPAIAKGDIKKHILEFDGIIAEVNRLRRDNKGFVLATMHMANWEMGALAMSMSGLPLFVIARRQKNPLTDEYLLRIRKRAGADIVMNDQRVMKKIIRKLKQGDIFAILPDVRARTPALDIEYLGGHANIGGGMGMFARQTNLPILPAYGTRIGWIRHKWTLLEPVYPDPSLDKREDWRRMTQTVMSRFSDIVREYPEQYFWYNKRWVLDPL